MSHTPYPMPMTPCIALGHTRGLVLNALPISADVALGTDTAVAALCVLTHLLHPCAHWLLGTGTLIHIWGRGRTQAGLGQ